jgi:hypothetical protein
MGRFKTHEERLAKKMAKKAAAKAARATTKTTSNGSEIVVKTDTI